MVLLIDLDSVLYSAVYRIVTISQIRDALEKYGKEGARLWLNEEVYNEGINRCENQLLQIQTQISEMMFNDITGVELFITTCKNSFRKKLAPSYKANRKKNKYVWMLRDHYQLNGAKFSDTLEADDLIAMRAKMLGVDNCIVVSIDKDLKQIGGYYWSYYKVKSKDMQGNFILDEYENHVKEYKMKQIDFITKEEADNYFWCQMLIGDTSDNIQGIKGLGPVKSKKIVSPAKNKFIAVAREYIKRDQKEEFRTNYQLLKLG